MIKIADKESLSFYDEKDFNSFKKSCLLEAKRYGLKKNIEIHPINQSDIPYKWRIDGWKDGEAIHKSKINKHLILFVTNRESQTPHGSIYTLLMAKHEVCHCAMKEMSEANRRLVIDSICREVLLILKIKSNVSVTKYLIDSIKTYSEERSYYYGEEVVCELASSDDSFIRDATFNIVKNCGKDIANYLDKLRFYL